MTDISSAPRISVIIPSFNCAGTLADAIDSVLAQTVKDIEVIVVDDGSTDDTPELLGLYLKRIRIISQANRGLPAARNAGIRAAKAPLIALLDADDTWRPTKLERQLPYFADVAVGIVYSDFSVRYADGHSKCSYLADRQVASGGLSFNQYIQSRILFPSTMVLRLKAMEECGLFDEEMLACEDIELFARMLLRTKAVMVNEALMHRFEGAENITANHDKLSRYTILALQKILAKEQSLPADSRRVIHRELSRQYMWRGCACFSQGRMDEVRANCVRAVGYDCRRCLGCGKLFLGSLMPDCLLRRCKIR